VWEAPETTAQERQEIVRRLLERVTVHVVDESAQVDVTLHWAGGVTSGHRVIRPGARYNQLSTFQALSARVARLHRQGLRFEHIAEHVHHDGFYPPKRPDRFHGRMVARLLSANGLHGPRPRTMGDMTVLSRHAYWLTDCARLLQRPLATVHRWQRVGWVHSRTVTVAAGRWAIWADAEERERLQRLRASKRKWPEPRDPAALTTPKCREPTPDAHTPAGITQKG
jgi:hypothetical protein